MARGGAREARSVAYDASLRARISGGEEAAALLAACAEHSIGLLRRNLTRCGVLAASPGARAARRGYDAIFGRDAAVCALGMHLSGDPALARAAPRGLELLARYQAPNGQIPKFVDPGRREADFWYLGCIDATLWWLLALALLDRLSVRRPARARRRGAGSGTRAPPAARLRAAHAAGIARAIDWLLAQEHQRFFLLQQNEASDWADIMPRSGFVLYTNALWYAVKRLYGLPRAAATRASFNGLFHPFSAGLPEYRRARLLNDYALRRARERALYLSFVNFTSFGEEGDVFGNLLAVLFGLPDGPARRRILQHLLAASAAQPFPARSVLRPIRRSSVLWRPYMARHRQNLAWQYHNGGIWPMIGGFWVTALVAEGRHRQARADLTALARACALGGWRFAEWLHGRSGAPRGMPGQSWNAAAFLIARHAVLQGADPLRPDQLRAR